MPPAAGRDEAAGPNDRGMAIGLEQGGETFALIVDGVGEVLKLGADTKENAPINLDSRWRGLTDCVHRLEGRLLVILDVDGGPRFRRPVAAKRREGRRESQPETTCLVWTIPRCIRKVARRIIEEIGYAVSEAEDGDSALELCAKAMPDFILLDWNMPNKDGYAFLQELRPDRGRAPAQGGVLHHRERCRPRSPGRCGPGPTSTS